MTRYRAVAFGKPLAPWQATHDLAVQSAVEANCARRDPDTGIAFLSPNVEIAEEEGDVPLTPEMALWAEALVLIRQHHVGAKAFATAQMERLYGDQPRRARWQMLRRRIVHIMDAAGRRERR